MTTTAKKFFKNEAKTLQSDWEDVPLWMIESAIEFTKLHCIEQARVIYNNAELIEVFTYDTGGRCQIANDMGDMYELDKASILSAYPLDNIK